MKDPFWDQRARIKWRERLSVPVIEKFTENTRFCLICNYLSKLIPAIQSRCTRFRFAPLQREQMLTRVQSIAKEEEVRLSPEGLNALIQLSQGDMRRALNTLQSTALAFGEDVTEENVYACVGQPQPRQVRQTVEWMLEEDIQTAFQSECEKVVLETSGTGEEANCHRTLCNRMKNNRSEC